jgi:hypothetical protein
VAACDAPAAKVAVIVEVLVRLKDVQVLPLQDAFPVPTKLVRVDVPTGVAVHVPIVVPEVYPPVAQSIPVTFPAPVPAIVTVKLIPLLPPAKGCG